MARLLNKVEKTEFFKNQMKGHQFYTVKEYVSNYDIIILNNGDFIEIDKPSIKKECYNSFKKEKEQNELFKKIERMRV